ncbi:MAG: penicillin acylase family protein [Bacteroidales bacterium]|nr:penicillin acylase family protein [Bacteroidales bacterium]MBN2762811.1 penicillin acylase family protein [Bacteroidales bacterium]
MKLLKRTLLAFLVFLVVLIIGAFIAFKVITRRALPDYNKDIALKGLQSEVTVMRDQYAVPHIYAENEHDLYMAVGYAMAQDRLWQMDFLRRVTQGRLSEIFGESFVNTDYLLRLLRYQYKSEKILLQSDPSVVEALQAFSDGVNQYITHHKRKLPVEFTILGYKPEPWEPVHSLNLIGYMAWDLKAGWSEIILEEVRQKVDTALYDELLPELEHQKFVVYPDSSARSLSGMMSSLLLESGKLEKLGADVFDASNNWAVSGNRSVTNMPLLANDMHLGLNVPGIWMQMHEVIPGRLNVTGLVLPGQPLIVCGHNDSIAWGMTNTYVDNLDFYEEKINPADSNQYEFMGEWKEFNTIIEKITTKEGRMVEKELKFSHRGAVISGIKDFPGKTVSMHWVGDEPSNEMQTIYLLNRADNWDDFKNALRTFQAISQNIVYADKSGNIGLYCAAGVPIRKRDEVIAILPGWTDEYDWKGYVPFEELPHLFNPEADFVASANNKTAGDDYPFHIGTWYSLPGRFQRITALLTAKEQYSIDDMKAIQLDQYSKMAEDYVPALIDAIKDVSDMTDTEKQAAEVLKKWDFNMNADAAAPLLFECIYLQTIRNLYSDEMGNALGARFKANTNVSRIATEQIWLKEKSLWTDDIVTPAVIESFSDILLKSFKETVDSLIKQYGSDVLLWQWSKPHQITFSHPLSKVAILEKLLDLNRGPFPVGGSFHTVSPYSYSFSNPFMSDHGASHRHIFDLSNWDNSITVIPTGNSGIPASPHYCDQTSLYIDGKYHADHFSLDAVDKNAIYRMMFKTGSRDE